MINEIAKLLSALIALFCVIGVFVYLTEHRSCTNKWKDSGYESKYEIFSECLVKLPDGSWVPSQLIKIELLLTNKAN